MIKRILCSIAILTLYACSPKDDGPPQDIDMDTSISVVSGSPALRLGEVLSLIPIEPSTAKTEQIITDENCTMPQARAGAKIISIAAQEGGANKPSPLFIARQRAQLQRGGPIFDIHSAWLSHVIITDTSQPIYLILSSNGSALWSLHTQRGVKIDGITVISGAVSGLAGAQIDKSRIGFITRSKANYRTCWKPVQAYSPSQSRQCKLWQSWLGRKVGGTITQDLGDYSLAAALVGTAPETPLRSRPFTGVIYVGKSDDFTFWGHEHDARIEYPGLKR